MKNKNNADLVRISKRNGLRKGRRQHVHLSADIATAQKVGSRRRPAEVAILRIAAAEMAANGFEFYRSANGVWLTHAVPPAYLTRHQDQPPR